MPAVRRTHRLTLAMDAAAPLLLDELRQLDEWLHGRIAEAEEEIPADETPFPETFIVWR
jgi:hypothetical protein